MITNDTGAKDKEELRARRMGRQSVSRKVELLGESERARERERVCHSGLFFSLGTLPVSLHKELLGCTLAAAAQLCRLVCMILAAQNKALTTLPPPAQPARQPTGPPATLKASTRCRPSTNKLLLSLASQAASAWLDPGSAMSHFFLVLDPCRLSVLLLLSDGPVLSPRSGHRKRSK